jgi:UDP-N-acetylmuramate: L-alanyl-gamma-D-glutamyl-meso-diaminopimelate ligase
LFSQDFDNSALLLMSSGNYGGLNFDEVKELMK